MDINFEEQIRERAYQIWVAGGMSDGKAHEHWVSAEQAVLVEITTAPAPPEAVAAVAPAKPKRKTVAERKVPRAKAIKSDKATESVKAKH